MPSVEQQDNARLADSLLHSLQGPESPNANSGPSAAGLDARADQETREHVDGQQQPSGTANNPAGPASPAAGTQHATNNARMRSSIACIRCRRSKVKCVNNGVGTTCRACENGQRDCQYPSPIPSGTRRRDSVSGRADGATSSAAGGGGSGGGGGGDGERRQRPRKSNHAAAATAARDSPRAQLDALDPSLLTPSLWQELFDIFQVHYSADLPFLHSPTFLRPLRLGHGQRASGSAANFGADVKPDSTTARPPASTEFLLAFLALTARHHPKLIAHHSPNTSSRASNPRIASEYYAAAANERIMTFWIDNRSHDIEFTQACLMLGLHEWGACRGAKAWLLVGLAIRSAQAMGLQYELDLDDEPHAHSVALSAEAEQMGVSTLSRRKHSVSSPSSHDDHFIQQEIRRRTFWSCYIMDRYLSSGKYRPQMLHAKELRIQLPASEKSFMFAEKVRTLMLGDDDKATPGSNARAEVQNQRQLSVMLGTGGTPERNYSASPHRALRGQRLDGSDDDSDNEEVKLETGQEEGLVSRYIKILEIYGRVIKWSCSGGRRKEEHPPWDPRCTFYQLNQQCRDFKASLPSQQVLSHKNTQAHISMKTSTPYALLHTVYQLCQIMLHREYVPFIPLRCSEPSGPLDAPTFPPDRYPPPPNFWHDSARECFKAARKIMDLALTCQEWTVLVETPIVGFAVYTVAFVGVYCMNFPWMDPDGYMCTRQAAAKIAGTAHSRPSEGFEAARRALEMIGSMRPKLHMADGWFNTINLVHRYFRIMKSDWRKNVQAIENNGSMAADSPESVRRLSLREGGGGGGLDEYKLLERTLKEFGNLEDMDVEMTDISQGATARAVDAVYDESSAGATTVKSEDQDHRAEQAPNPPNQQDAGSWSAINAAPNGQQARSQPAPTPPTSGQFRSYDSYPPQQQNSQQPQSTSAQHYSHQLTGFRPAYSQDTPSASNAPPSLVSPASHAATTPSQQSPPLERPQGYGSNWAGPNHPYGMQLPPFGGNIGQSPAANQPHAGSVYAAQSSPVHSHHQHHRHHPSATSPQQQSFQQSINSANTAAQMHDAMGKESWLNSIDTRLGGDDIAAFVDGSEIAEWANMAAQQGFGGGWLSCLFNNEAPNGNGTSQANVRASQYPTNFHQPPQQHAQQSPQTQPHQMQTQHQLPSFHSPHHHPSSANGHVSAARQTSR